jgi:hypothetical protein
MHTIHWSHASYPEVIIVVSTSRPIITTEQFEFQPNWYRQWLCRLPLGYGKPVNNDA